MKLTSVTVILLVLTLSVECGRYGGGRSSYRGGGSTSSRSGGWSHSSNSHTSSNTNRGWQQPSSSNSHSSSSNTGHSSSSNSGTSSNSHTGWQPSNTHTGSSSSGSSQPSKTYGWQTSNTHSGTNGNTHSSPSNTGHSQSSSGHTGTSSNGQSQPSTSNTHSGTSGNTQPSTNNAGHSTNTGNTGSHTSSGSGTDIGWKKPETGNTGTNYGWKNQPGQTGTSNPSNKQPPPYTPHDPNKVQTQPNRQPPPSYTPHDPNKTPQGAPPGYTPYNTYKGPQGAPPGYTPYDPRSHPSQNIGPRGYPVQQYNTGAYTAGHPPTYTHAANPASYGYNPHSYPTQNYGGYPGQGMYPGSHSATYGGMNVYNGGGPHGYGYPGGNSWGYPSYGSSRSSTGDILTGVAIGYVGSSVLHKITNPNPNPWHYSGSGYGNGYGYQGGHNNGNVYVTNNYNNPGQGTHPSNPENKVMECVAFDHPSKQTLFNPNCTCVTTSNATENMVYKCTTKDGRVVEGSVSSSGSGNGVQGGNNNGNVFVTNPGQGTHSNTPENKWISCVAFDPETKQTLFNPNCTCVSTSNATDSMVYKCTTKDGRDVEELVTPRPQDPSSMKYENRYATGAQTYMGDNLVLTKEEEIEKQRNEIYKKLDKMLNMGKFSS